MNNIWAYLLIASIISVQLVEFFIWRNLKNKFYNTLFSVAFIINATLQPIFSLMLLTKLKLRNTMLLTYFCIAIPTLIYNLSMIGIHTSVSKNGNLTWRNLIKPNDTQYWITSICWLFFFTFSFFYEKMWIAIAYSFITLAIICYNYYNYKSEASMWCWIANSLMICFAFYLLFVLPFYEKANIC